MEGSTLHRTYSTVTIERTTPKNLLKGMSTHDRRCIHICDNVYSKLNCHKKKGQEKPYFVQKNKTLKI